MSLNSVSVRSALVILFVFFSFVCSWRSGRRDEFSMVFGRFFFVCFVGVFWFVARCLVRVGIEFGSLLCS